LGETIVPKSIIKRKLLTLPTQSDSGGLLRAAGDGLWIYNWKIEV